MPSSLQTIIIQLQDFWAQKGCLITQPYYTQVGAGTMNPNTFLRVLGPEPWNVAYVEPCVRPDDGRYGENPNRFHQHTQFQVILKPDPGNPVELYLDSLKALGVDPRQHDIRLVEDNWEQPAISAWGLGWEVWLDGQEITQFTYFQQVGGLSLDPVSVEITYGLERILIALNNAPAIWDEPWGPGVTYGEVRQREEYEHSKYYFEVGDVERLRQMYDLYRLESEACLQQGLVLPAYDHVLKCSHTFNALDCRGAIGVTERQAYYAQMRTMARQVAEHYVEQRKELEYPLLKTQAESQEKSTPSIIHGPSSAVHLSSIFGDGPSSFLMELGVEELPVSDLNSALEQLQSSIPALLNDLHLEHGPITVLGTPRRLVVLVDSLAPHQPDRLEHFRGPAADRAFTPEGTPTPAAVGFAKGKGVDVTSLEVREENGGKYVYAVVKSTGRPAVEVLSEALPGLIASLKFDKSMRWNASGVAFSRPLRWFVSLLGETLIPFEFAGLQSGRLSRGLRPHDSPAIEITSAGEYQQLMAQNGILLDSAARKTSIVEQVTRLAASVKGEALMPPELLDEVANLVEQPFAILASFEPGFLQLPREVLISVMKKHQRYFPLQRDGKLLPHFVVIRNGDDQGQDLVRQGNEHVVRARFADADFFVREDLKHSLEYLRPRLTTLVFQKKLGSMLDRSDRIEKLVNTLSPMLALDADETIFARRAAHLCKADLVSRMVVEMTSLQGIMGGEYARRAGEAPAVCEAIATHYLPIPKTKPALAVSLADRLDSLVGLFAAGLAPTGTKDPFALRRAAIGVVQPLMEHALRFDLAAALHTAAKIQPIPVSEENLAQVQEFITGRLRVVLLDLGFRYDVVEAVLSAQSNDPFGAKLAAEKLTSWVARPDWSALLPAYARCVRILRSAPEEAALAKEINPAILSDPAEKALDCAVGDSDPVVTV